MASPFREFGDNSPYGHKSASRSEIEQKEKMEIFEDYLELERFCHLAKDFLRRFIYFYEREPENLPCILSSIPQVSLFSS